MQGSTCNQNTTIEDMHADGGDGPGLHPDTAEQAKLTKSKRGNVFCLRADVLPHN